MPERSTPLGEGWTRNSNVRLHYLASGGEVAGHGAPVLFIPGMSQTAEDFAGLMASLAPRRCVAATLRGRGRSDAPKSGYALEDHVADIEAVVAQFGLGRFNLFAFSRGVAYALGYAVRHPDRLTGLIIGDYPAHHSAISQEWVDAFLGSTFHGKAARERMPEHAIRAIQREARQALFWDDLTRIKCPVLILKGGAEGSLLSRDQAERYLRAVPDARLVVFEGFGHDLWADGGIHLAETLNEFLTGAAR
ncbi:MAG: alpha/beta fold hydrolase [Bacillota bacterium]